MTRPTASDRACLEAQVQAQVAQRLTAELAVSCPDCGVEPGRACRDSFDRAVQTHLERVVASSKRDTVPCPPPSMLERGLESESFRALQEFCDRFNAARLENPPWTGEGSSVRCPICDAEPGAKCRTPLTGPLSHAHWLRAQAEQRAKTPVASDCAPSPAASAPEASCNGVVPSRGDSGRPVCACGQTVWRGELDFDGSPICSDCSSDKAREHLGEGKPAPLDQRIREAQPDESHQCAWSTPTSDGEGWR